jgi:hypothetical protein
MFRSVFKEPAIVVLERKPGYQERIRAYSLFMNRKGEVMLYGNYEYGKKVLKIRLDSRTVVVAAPPEVLEGITELRNYAQQLLNRERDERARKDIRNQFIHSFPNDYVGFAFFC